MKYFIFSILIFCFACGSDSNKEKEERINPNETIQNSGNQAVENIEKSTLTNHIWEIEIILNNGQIDGKNQWINSSLEFRGNNTYSWQGAKFTNNGKYTVDLKKNIVLLESDNAEQNSEWSIKHNKAMMVWIGTPKFGHHSVQMKLVKRRGVD